MVCSFAVDVLNANWEIFTTSTQRRGDQFCMYCCFRDKFGISLAMPAAMVIRII
jgi:hypothetical protein